MEPELSASHRSAEAVARTQARNFYYSFRVLPPDKRRAFCAVYAFMRSCDDISDGDAATETKRRQLEQWRAQLEEAYAGGDGQNPIMPAFRESIERFSIPAEYFHWIIDGAEMDLDPLHYESFEDLYRYCFHVASAVGFVCLQIFGYKERAAKEYAEKCGIAFQLTNILRDVKEDAAMGRIYLPGEDLREFRYAPEELRDGIINDRFRDLMAFEAERAKQYYAQARGLLPLVDKDSRPALWAMMEIYERLLDRIVRSRFDVFRNRVRLSGMEKTSIALKALLMRFTGTGI
jgi:phytoene synthase